MNALTTRSEMPSAGYCGQADLTIELAKMLALVAPSSMSAEQQEMWLRAAIDALEDIRADEVIHVSPQVRRSVKRHNDIVPEICKLVSERRKERSDATRRQATPRVEQAAPREPGPPLTAAEIAAMPKWIRDMGLRVGFLRKTGDGIVDVQR